MALTAIVLLVLALYMVQIVLQETSRFGFNLQGIDHPPRTTWGERTQDAQPQTRYYSEPRKRAPLL